MGEMTSTRWGQKTEVPDFKYPYNSHDGRENYVADDPADRRVIRGGSFETRSQGVRAAFRYGDSSPQGCSLLKKSFEK